MLLAFNKRSIISPASRLICIILLIISGLIYFRTSRAKALESCQILWGKSQIEPHSCHIKILSIGEPILIQISKDINKDLNRENLFLHLKAQQVESINGLQIRFLKNKNIMFHYDLPLFEDSYFNLLQNNLASEISLAFSDLKKSSSINKNTTIDEVQIYLDIKNQKKFELDILSLTWKKKSHAKGLVSISFDDGYASQFKAAQIMKQNQIPGIAYLIPDAIGKAHYLNKTQIADLKKWHWDISSHHQTPITDFKVEDLYNELKSVSDSIKALSERQTYKHFAYPLGRYNGNSLEQIKKVFKSARLASGGFETLPPADHYRLRAVNVSPLLSAIKLNQMANDAIKNGDWVIFMFHYIDEPEKAELNYPLSEFENFINLIKSNKKNIKTVNNILIK
jgi:peptidoglycan/xylan/chitin deacetylase (PgdA/CDA1 family)